MTETVSELANLKIKEIEMKNELKLKEAVLKQKLKESIKKELHETKCNDENETQVITWRIVEASNTIDQVMEDIINSSEVEDYQNMLFDGADYDDIFLRDFLAQYNMNKCIVIAKDSKKGDVFYKRYEGGGFGAVWSFYLNEEGRENRMNYFLKVIPYHYQRLQDLAKECGFYVKDFTLSEETKKRLENNIIETITMKFIIG
jgi:hypothetical protein